MGTKTLNSLTTHLSSRAASVVFLAAFPLTTLAQDARETHRPAFPAGIRLAATVRGETAITALGNKLPEVAAHYRKTPEELRALLRSDQCLHANTEGRLFYACDLHKHAEAPGVEEAPSAAIGPTDPAPFPTEEAFLLHTRSGANRVIYLDFDGHIDNTPGNWKDGASAPPFDTNGDPAVFSASERERIIYIWQRVAEDFAMFNIDVTTEDPGVEALRKSNGGDQIYGIRCVIGGSSGGPDDWYTSSVGGVAFVGSFDASNDVPCWVFPGNLGNSEKNIAEAASHEVGHTLGLGHDGTSSVGYYTGHGNWAPIMGVGYSKDIVQWSKGEYSGANNTQDDLAVMLTQGAVYRTDDHGGTTATATFLTSDVLPVLGEGVIEKRTDLDFFRVAAAGGSLSINATLAPRSSNLRLEIKLYDSTGTLLQTASVTDSASTGTLPVTLTRSVSTGTHYFSVDGIGSGDPLSTGYSDYASLGQYILSVNGVTPAGTTWLPTAAGTYQWNTLANWSASPVINAAGATLRLTNNIAGNQNIDLTTPVTIGNLYLGDSNSTHSFTLASNGGSLTFNNLTADAKISKTTGTHDTISATLAFTSNLVVTQSASGNLSLTGPVTGAGSLTKTGAGTLILSGAKSYTGTTTVDDGVLRIDTSDALPSGNVTLTGGGIIGLASTFSGRTDGTGANQVQWTGDGGFAAYGADRSVGLGSMSWASASLNGNNLILGHSTADATLIWASNLSFAGGSRTIQVNDGSDPIDAKISGVLSGGGTFNKTGGGTLELTNTNTYTAITNLADGLLLLSHANALPTTNLILAGGTLGLGNGNLTDRALGTSTSQVRWTAESGFAAFGTTRAVKFSTSSLNWTDTNFIGNGRNLVLSHPTANATLDWQQAISFAGDSRTIEVLDGSAAIDAQISAIIAGGTSGNTNQLNKTGEGTLTLTEQNTYFGDTNINAGTLMIGNGGTTGGLSQNTPAIIVSSGANLAVNRSDTVTQGGSALKSAISGDGDFSQIGGGTTILNLSNTYTGDTTISAGALEISGAGRLGGGAYPGSLAIGSGTTFRYSGSNNQILSGPISGTGALIKDSNPSTLTLSGANTSFGGNLTVNAGAVSLGHINALGGTSAITLASGTLATALNGISTNAPITLGATGSTSTVSFGIASAATATLTLNGTISGAGNLTFTTPNNNSGNFLQAIILGSANTYAGSTLITTGDSGNTMSVRSGITNALPTSTVLTLDGGNGEGSGRTTSYDLNGFNQTLAGLTNVTGLTLRNQRIQNTAGTAATLTIQDNSNRTFSGTITGTNLGLTKSGSGTFTLTGANTHTGATTVSAGTLAIGANNALADSSAVSIGNATLAIAAAFSDTLGILDVSGTASINLGAGSTLAFSNSSSIDWTGGTLNITGSFVSGTSLRFGTSSSGLTPAQLASISAPGFTALALNANGYLIAASYATWKTTHAPSGTPGDDYDGDGVANAIEYVLGGTATTRDAAKLPQATTSGGNFVLSFIRDQASIDGTTNLTIETGTNLASWPSSYAVPAGAVANNPGLTVAKNLPTAGKDTITLTLPLSLSSGTLRFARLSVVP